MGDTYTRQSSYTDGDVITAAHTNNEFNQILAAFAASTGHTHDGTAAEGGPITKLLGNTLTFGAGTAGTDITITFDGETSDGELKWMEDEDYFEFSDDILVASTEKIQFGDTASFIQQSSDGVLRIDGEATVDINASTAVLVSNDLKLDSDAAVLGFGVDNDVTLTHVADTALLLNSTRQLQFGDSGTYIHQSADGVLDLVADTEIEINATTIDINGNVDISGTLTIGSAGISETELEILDGASVTTTELNILDGDTTASSTTVADADRVVFNDAGTMKQVAVTDLAAYFDDEITAMPNLTSVGTLTTLTVDNVIINGSTIGHTGDTDLMTVASGVLTVAGEVDAASLDISGDADIDGTLEADAITVNGTALNTVIAGVTVTDATNSAHVLVTDNESTNEENLITFVENATTSTGNVGLEMDGTLTYNPSTGTVTSTIFKGNIDAVDGDFDGTLEADAITLDGTAITTVATLSTGISNGNLPVFTSGAADNDFLRIDGTSIEGRSASEVLSDIAAAPAAGSSNIVTTGAINSGSITSGFGAIDNGSSAITTTGTITFGSLADGSITVTAFVDEDDMSSDSATLIPTQQSVKAYVDNNAGSFNSFQLEDDDGTEVTINNAKELKIIGSGVTTNFTDTSTGSDGDPFDLTITVDAAQTGITSLLATDIKIGEDDQTKIDFETADEIHFYAANVEQVYLGDNIFGPQSDSDVDLGSSSVRWKDAYVDSLTSTGTITGGSLAIDNITINGTEVDLSSGTFTIDSASDITLDADGGAILFKDGGTEIGRLFNSSSDLILKSAVSDKDMKFQGNDGGAAVNALILDMSAAGAATFNAGATFADGCTITTADNDAQLTLISTDADENTGPMLALDRNSSSPANGDILSRIKTTGRNNAGESFTASLFQTKINDVTDGGEDAEFKIETMTAGSVVNRLNIIPSELVINDGSIDADFRVESDNEANALFVQGSSGNVGIGTNAPSFGTTSSAGLEIAHATRGILRLEGNSAAQALELYGDSAGGTIDARGSGAVLAFDIGGSEKARLDASGNFHVAKTSDGNDVGCTFGAAGFMRVVRDGTTAVFNRSSDGTNITIERANSTVGGVNVTSSGTTFATTSDIRLKQDIEPLEATDKLMNMNPVSYAWKVDPDGPRSMGFIAQEMEEVMPEAVNTGDNGMMQMDYGRITPILVSALQNAHKKIEELESRIAAMESK